MLWRIRWQSNLDIEQLRNELRHTKMEHPRRWTGGAPLQVFLVGVGVSVSVGGPFRRLVHDRGLGGV
jgi:hypothetical protein